jgi:coiled-coil-helix-coiled-coil-helix domain-containing protein 2
MIAQMAATAGSVAIGSTIGHGLSSMLFGGSSAATAEPAQQPAAQPVQEQNQGISCDVQAKGNVQCIQLWDVMSSILYPIIKTLRGALRLLMFSLAPGILSS